MADVMTPPNVTGQTQRDLHKIRQRKNKNKVMYARMQKHLAGISKGLLLRVANEISTTKEIPPADRICRRNRDALICWFCEACPEMLSRQWILIPAGLPEPDGTLRLPLPPISGLVRDFPVIADLLENAF